MNKLILVLGASGYVGQAFLSELARRNANYRALSRSEVDYTCFTQLRHCLMGLKPEFVVNCAGYTGKPNVDACEENRADTLLGNALLPQTIGQACEVLNIPWGHVSSGCIYSGAKVRQPDGSLVVERDLLTPANWRLVQEQSDRLIGFNEADAPNFSFRASPCSFYSGSKALGEEALPSDGSQFIWRLRIPFDEWDSGRNYLSKLQRYAKVYENVNSISHRGDFSWACLELWAQRAPFGTYHITNPGHVTSRQVVHWIESELRLNRTFEFWDNDESFYRHAAKTPRSNCILDTTKLQSAGVQMRSVEEAVVDSLKHWRAVGACE